MASITDTESEPLLVTYTRAASGEAATPIGLLPTGIVAVTVLVAVSSTDTLLAIRSVM